MVEVYGVGLLLCGPDSASTTIVSGCVRLNPTVTQWVCPCISLTTVLGGFRSVHLRGDGRAWHDNEASNVCRPSLRHSIAPRLTFVKRGAVQTRITREELHIAAQQLLFYHLLVAVRVRRVAGLAIWSDLARLHCMCAGTRLSILSLPPAARGITWSAVNASGCAVLRPQ